MSLQPGPCIICGATDYPLSMGGPTICPPCDCGPPNPVEVRKLREALRDSRAAEAALRDEIDALRARLIPEEERRKLEGDALHAEGECAALRARVEVLEAALRDAESGIVAALDALDNDRLAGQYLRSMKRQSVDNRSMHTELATVAMDSEKEARAALDRARAALSSSAPAATPDWRSEALAARAYLAAGCGQNEEDASEHYYDVRRENERREAAAAMPTTEEP